MSSPDPQPAAPRQTDRWLDPGATNVQVIYVLYLAGLAIGVSGIVGVVMAYINRGRAGGWVESHYTFLIRTFWIGLLYALISLVLMLLVIGFVLAFATAVWFIARCIVGLQAAGRGGSCADFPPAEWYNPVGHCCNATLMQTNFTLAQLADPHTAESEKILRACVHCGFCTATCPTYVTLGNELDSPRGRIYLIKDMLEGGRPADREIVTHIDRCLSCLSCMTTCPSGVNYMHLVDHARAHIEKTYRRPVFDRLIRAMLARVLPYPARFRAALKLARFGRPFAGLFDRVKPLKPLAARLRLAPASLPSSATKPQCHGSSSRRFVSAT